MGELFTALKEAGIDDNTLVFFTSDNGCSPQGNFEKLAEFGHDPSGGFRGHKADIYEGGHRVPFIARWPKGIKAGQKTSALACLTDLYDTMRDITGRPKIENGGEDSFSLVPAFKGKPKTTRSTLISHSISGQFSIRQGETGNFVSQQVAVDGVHPVKTRQKTKAYPRSNCLTSSRTKQRKTTCRQRIKPRFRN